MRFGVSYNVFDGEELLEASITQIRMHVDFICIVYQEVSNFGEKREDLKDFLQDLVVRGLVDKIYPYTPLQIKTKAKLSLALMNQLRGERNEIVKRNLGKEICHKLGGCTHYISLDCDEMFVSDEFAQAKEVVRKGDFDTSYVNYVNYYKKPTLRMIEDDKSGYFGYISFIVKIDSRKFGEGACPVILDPTRKIQANRYKVLDREEIQMHHYGYLRGSEESFRRKLNNTSFKRHPEMIKSIEYIVNSYINYQDGDKAITPWISGYHEKELEIVKDKISAEVLFSSYIGKTTPKKEVVKKKVETKKTIKKVVKKVLDKKELRSFKDIAGEYTDKVEYHRYDRFYPQFLEPLRDKEFNMLEIGYGEGGSLILWKEYFPKAHISIADIDIEDEDERSKVYKLDQSKEEDLQYMADNLSKCKLIVDDGSHHPYHQFITFIKLFKELLEPGGVYIIEDIECNYWNPHTDVYGYIIGEFKFMDLLKQYPDKINAEFTGVKNSLNISSITFGHNCVIITKETQEETDLKDRQYRSKGSQ